MRRICGVVVVLAALLLSGRAEAQSCNGCGIGYTAPAGGGACTFDPLAPVISDEFLGGTGTSGAIGGLGWATGGLGAAVTNDGVAEHPGRINLNQSTASAAGGIYLGPTNNVVLSNVASVTFNAMWNTGANVPHSRAGLLGSTGINAAPNASSVYFERLGTDTNWFAVTQDGVSPNYTRTDTGVAFAAGTYYTLKIAHPAASTWTFYINGTLVATRTTGNIPAESVASAPFVQIQTTGTALTSFVDYFTMTLTLSR